MSKEQIEELESLLSDFEDIILKVDNMMLQFEPDSDNTISFRMLSIKQARYRSNLPRY